VDVRGVAADDMILDVGPQTVAALSARLDRCKTFVWNAPNELAREVADLTEHGRLVSVAGGGDTLAALAHAGVTGRLTYVSTAGGAFLKWLEGKTLPGVAALSV
ncbi:MAG: phosphoglycerate kinase, partial [Alphaproteobacteria bacterium]|nr:phosphoglycerate kinase [Alphaproteobacteria bacterium]